MGLLDKLKDMFGGAADKAKDAAGDVAEKVGDVAGGAAEKVEDGLTKAADMVDDKTGGKYSDEIDTAKDVIDKVDGEDDDAEG